MDAVLVVDKELITEIFGSVNLSHLTNFLNLRKETIMYNQIVEVRATEVVKMATEFIDRVSKYRSPNIETNDPNRLYEIELEEHRKSSVIAMLVEARTVFGVKQCGGEDAYGRFEWLMCVAIDFCRWEGKPFRDQSFGASFVQAMGMLKKYVGDEDAYRFCVAINELVAISMMPISIEFRKQ